MTEHEHMAMAWLDEAHTQGASNIDAQYRDIIKAMLAAAAPSPGPWQATPTDPSEGGEFYWITACPASNQEREIATVSGPQNARNAANARLIAAAPNLLAALKEARDHVWACWDDGHAEHAGEIKADLDKVDAAIAEAEGTGMRRTPRSERLTRTEHHP